MLWHQWATFRGWAPALSARPQRAQRAPARCRFANPVNLNAAAGWVFVNDPEDIQHICSANTKNYAERYLPVRRTLGGSQEGGGGGGWGLHRT